MSICIDRDIPTVLGFIIRGGVIGGGEGGGLYGISLSYFLHMRFFGTLTKAVHMV